MTNALALLPIDMIELKPYHKGTKKNFVIVDTKEGQKT